MPTQEKKKRIEFVVLTWNSEKYIESCIISILAIRAFDIKLHVVDNGSTDRTVELLNIYEAASDGRMNVVRLGRNLGTTLTRNIALRSVGRDADYVCVLDSDTVINENAFVKMARKLDLDPTIGLIGPSMKSSAGIMQVSGRNMPTVSLKIIKSFLFSSISDKALALESPTAPIKDSLQEVGYLLSACWLLPREVLDKVGLLDEHYFYAPEDVDYCMRVHRAGYRVVRDFDAEIIHEYQRISKRKMVSMINLEHIKGLSYYFAKYHYVFHSPSICFCEKEI